MNYYRRGMEIHEELKSRFMLPACFKVQMKMIKYHYLTNNIQRSELVINHTPISKITGIKKARR